MFSRFAILAFGFSVAASAVAQDCATLDGARTYSSRLPGAVELESERYVLHYRTQPPKIAVGQHFTVEFAVCPKSGQTMPDSVRVDGFMPEHNHGMNYQAVVKPDGAGRYNAAGLMFHMPGKWNFIFDMIGGGKTDRMTDSVMLH